MTFIPNAPIDPNHHKGLIAADEADFDPFAVQGTKVNGAINVNTFPASGTTQDINITEIGGETITGDMPTDDEPFVPTRTLPQKKKRFGFDEEVSGGVSDDLSIVAGIGTGMGVNQTGGNLVITAGTTARSEVIIRSDDSWRQAMTVRYAMTLSQRNANNNIFIEMVDVIGDALTYTISSATAITVTKTAHGFTSANVGQSMWIGGFSGTGTFVTGNYVIASVPDVDNITFTVSGFAVGTGTCSLWGWNYHSVLYTSTTATNALYGSQRRGRTTANTTVTVNTTATGHIGIINSEDGIGTFLDQLSASATTLQNAVRGSINRNLPDSAVELKLQIRVSNGKTNPTATTITVGFVNIEDYIPQQVSLVSTRSQSFNASQPVSVLNTPAVTGSGNFAVTMAANATTTPAKARDGVAGVSDTGIPGLFVRRDTPTSVTPIAGDYEFGQIDAQGSQWVRNKISQTPAQSTVAGSASNVTLLASNTSRLGATITNDSSAVLYLKLGATASTTSYTVTLAGNASAPFSYYEVPYGYTGIIDGIWASATGNARITELT